MFYLSILVVSFLTTHSLASPMQLGIQCPGNGTDIVFDNFTLVAVYKNDFSFRSELVVNNSSPPPGSDLYLVTKESMGMTSGDNFLILLGGLHVSSTDGKFRGWSQDVAHENGLLKFQEGVANRPMKISSIYCELRNVYDGVLPAGHPPDSLSIYGDNGENFSLCPSLTSNQILVVYNVSEADSQCVEFDSAKCNPVFINIVPSS